MDIFSLLVFFIYALIILVILVYISPMLSAFLLILLPAVSVLLLPGLTLDFLSIEQFSVMVPVYNVHILLLIWSALIGIIAYAEVLSWYLLRETKPGKKEKPAGAPEPSKPGEALIPQKTTPGVFLQKIFKLLKGQKS